MSWPLPVCSVESLERGEPSFGFLVSGIRRLLIPLARLLTILPNPASMLEQITEIPHRYRISEHGRLFVPFARFGKVPSNTRSIIVERTQIIHRKGSYDLV